MAGYNCNPFGSKYGPKWKEEYIDSLMHWAEDFVLWTDGVDAKGRRIANDPPVLEKWVSSVPKVSMFTIFEWKKNKPGFKEAWEIAQQRVEGIIVEGTMSGAYESRFVQFYLKNRYDYKDKVEAKLEMETKVEDLLKEINTDANKY